MAVSVTELLDDVLGVQESQLRNLHISVEKKFVCACSVHGFPGELRQIFLNLIANAIEAMPNGGKLRLTVRKGSDWIEQRQGIHVLVTDTGVGIKRQDARKLFEPFFSTKSTKGTGLGLWISKGIAQKYEGRISFRSYCPGPEALTSFRVFFPSNGVFHISVASDAEIETVTDDLNLNGKTESMNHTNAFPAIA